jgi:hypothetical protein
MNSHLNLLPLEHRVRETARRQLLHWCLVWALCAVGCGGVWWLKQGRCRAVRQRLEVAQRDCAPVKQTLRENERLRRELDRLLAKETVLGKLLDEKPPLALIGVVSRSARTCNGRLVVGSLLFRRHERPSEVDAPAAGKPRARPANSPAAGTKGPPEPAAPKTEPWGSVALDGKATDNVAVATFVVNLRESGLFRRVELKSSVDKSSADEKVRTYSLECDI